MIAIIPVFFEGDRELWCGAEGKALMLKSINSTTNVREIKKIIIFTNDNSIINLAESLGIDSYLIEIDTEAETSELLPLGSCSSVRYVKEALKIDFENLMILSFKNPLITSDLIDEAINKFKVSKTPALISVKKPIDHPCQLNAYYRILDLGFIHIFDEGELICSYIPAIDSKHYRLTKPFYFDWKARGIQEKNVSGMYIRTYEDLSIKYIPVEQVSDDTFEILFPLWIYESPNKARILFQFGDISSPLTEEGQGWGGHSPVTPFQQEKKNSTSERTLYRAVSKVDKDFQLAGAAFSDNFNYISCFLFKDFQGSEYLLALNSENFSSHSFVLRILPIRESVLAEEGTIEVEIDDISKPILFQYKHKDICGIVYSLLNVAQDDTYDLCEPFPPDERLWTGSMQKINVETGKEIMGRQDFPDVFEPEGTFFIMRKDLISSFDKEVLNGNTDGFIMEDTNSIQIKSGFDLLRYRAIIRVATTK
ncbi:MAG: hypothetical protein JRJ42_11755 [Deltaproteobacteria bacterium]|nr:hypothetical protein [Deltaproteobacteria bacterium]